MIFCERIEISILANMRLFLLLTLAGCATASAAAPKQKPKDPYKEEVHHAETAMQKGAFDEAAAALDRAAQAAAADQKKLAWVKYDRTVLAVYRGDLPKAAALLAADLPALAQHQDSDDEFWAHNELTWIRWAAGDLAGALVETGEQRRCADTVALSPKDKASLLRHALWDRAYLLRELAASQPESSRAPTIVYARAAREEYDRAAQAIGGEDGQAVLEAWFALNDGDGAAAAKAAKRVDAAKDGDIQDLYVLQRALELGGDTAAAEAIRERIRKSENVYLGLPIYQHQLELDAKTKAR
jgi:hypothetical protein